MSRRNPRDKQTGSIFKPGPHSLPDLKPGKRPAATEAQTEAAIIDRLKLAGWSEKTDAGQIGRGSKRGTMTPGFPDVVAILGVPGSRWSLVALIEVKTDTGKLNANQVLTHTHLRASGIQPLILRSQDDVPALLSEGKRLRERLKHD